MSTIQSAIFSFLFIFLLFSTSCESTHRIPSRKSQFKDVYIDQFKFTYFRQILNKSYNNSSAVREIIKNDHSGFTEPILTEEDYNLIDSLTTKDNQYLIADSIDGRRRAEGSQGKRPLGYIMEKLTSKWLDSLAKKRLKLNGIPKSWYE